MTRRDKKSSRLSLMLSFKRRKKSLRRNTSRKKRRGSPSKTSSGSHKKKKESIRSRSNFERIKRMSMPKKQSSKPQIEAQVEQRKRWLGTIQQADFLRRTRALLRLLPTIWCLRRIHQKKQKRQRVPRRRRLTSLLPDSKSINKFGEMPSLSFAHWSMATELTSIRATTVPSDLSSPTRSKTSSWTKASWWRSARKSSPKKWSTH